MDNKIFEGSVMGIIGQLSNELAMVKAMQYVQLEQIAKDNQIPLENLIKRAEQMHSQYSHQNLKINEDIINKAQNPDEPDASLKDLFNL